MNESHNLLYIPKWLFPNNLGDFVVSTFLPKIIKKNYPNLKLEVITSHQMVEVFKNDPYVDSVRFPFENELKSYLYWQQLAFSKHSRPENIFCIYPEWHPECFDKFSKKLLFKFKANIVLFNFLLQNKIDIASEEECSPKIYLPGFKKKKEDYLKIAIVPDTKLAGRASPHPGCDGIGYRFNGPNGEESWKQTILDLKEQIKVPHKIYEFCSHKFHNFDGESVHIHHIPSFVDLAKQVSEMDLGIMSDGGMHNMFNARNVPVILLGAQKVNKPEFFALNNASVVPPTEQCKKNCYPFLTKITGWPDIGITCDLSCEKVDPKSVVDITIKRLRCMELIN